MNKLTISTDNVLFPTNDLWGIFFEDINHAADGGLYPEMIRNRSFEFCEIDNPEYTHLTAWEQRGEGKIYTEDTYPLNDKNTNYLVLEPCGKSVSAVNLGFNTGLCLKQGESYNFSAFFRSENSAKILVTIESKDKDIYEELTFSANEEWTKYTASFKSSVTDYSARLAISVSGNSRAYAEIVSLMPAKTFKGHGLREDLAQLLADLKPKFLRFPGGCLTHDGSLNKDDRNALYRWVNTVGSIEDRPPRRNNWGYNQTAGLGFYEYFLLCEDIGAKPLPIISGAWNPHKHEGAAIEDLGEWIDEALALIEFANGGKNSRWGALRAEMGHEEPFGLEYIGVGNEEIAGGFFDRYPYFHKAIKERYPYMKIIGTSGPWANGYDFEYGWNEAKKNKSDLVDEHYYMTPEWFMENIDRYENYDRKGPKAFIGEYASWGNSYKNALAEACFMTAVENNADAVGLACYAPLFANVDYVNWTPDMIWFDNHRSYATVNYYVQKMFMTNQADYVVECNIESELANIPMPLAAIEGRVALGATRTTAEYYDIQIDGSVDFEIASTENGSWTNENGVFIQNDKKAVNSKMTFAPFMKDTKLTLKAKKTGGKEGLRIYFGIRNDENCYYWDIGGWNNDVSSINKVTNGAFSCIEPGEHIMIEDGREYSICLEARDNHILCSIDGKLYHDITEKAGAIRPIYCTCGIKDGNTVIKAANYRNEPYETEILLDRDVSEIEIEELCSDDLEAMNSFDEPEKLKPANKSIRADGHSFRYTFPPSSVTVMVIK